MENFANTNSNYFTLVYTSEHIFVCLLKNVYDYVSRKHKLINVDKSLILICEMERESELFCIGTKLRKSGSSCC